MKSRKTKTASQRALALGLCLVIFAAPVFAQGGNKPISAALQLRVPD
jgi:hypothetical protein